MDLQKRVEDQRRFFARKADEDYENVHQQFMYGKRALTEALPDGVRRVLDLGAGTGLELISLFSRFPEADVTAIDITEEMLAKLKQRPFAPRVRTIVGDFFAVDFGADYDAVISTSALHHFTAAEKERLYAKIFAALRPGGVFLNADRCADTLAQEEERMAELRTNYENYVHFDLPLAVETEDRLLTGAGFAPVEIEKLPESDYRLITARKAR